jgi:hypothetical protein
MLLELNYAGRHSVSLKFLIEELSSKIRTDQQAQVSTIQFSSIAVLVMDIITDICA